MELTPRQLSSLSEMGIPVWEFRSANSEKTTTISDDNVQQPSDWLLNCDWLILIDHENYSEQAQRLLHAMLFATGIEPEKRAIIDSTQLGQLKSMSMQTKVLFVLGNNTARRHIDKSITRGSVHHTLHSEVPTIVSLALDDLLENPHKKAQAWQDLQLAKQVWLK